MRKIYYTFIRIIQLFMLQYRKRVLRSLVYRLDKTDSVSDLLKLVNVSDALYWSISSWNAVSESTVKKCFGICGIITDRIDEEASQEELRESEELQSLARILGTSYDVDEELKNIFCYNDLSGDWEARLMEEGSRSEHI